MHASWLDGATLGDSQIAVIIEPATPTEVAEVIMLAYRAGTNRHQSRLPGFSTAHIANQPWITQSTVQDHLKSIFDKTGVQSRREVMARILHDHYRPGLKQGHGISPTGYFI